MRRRSRPSLWASSAAALLLLTACGGRAPEESLTLAGSTAFQPFAEKLAERYMELHPGRKVEVQGGGSAVGIQSALTGAAEIGMADLLELPPEAADLVPTTVARDGIAIVVHPSNPVRNLFATEAHDVFAGRTRDWSALGGPPGPVRVISREEGSGTRRSFDKLVLHGDRLAKDALFQNSNGTVREAVASDPAAVGYVSIGLVNDRVRAVSFDGVAPTNESVVAGSYALARPVYFLTRGQPRGPAKEFIDYVVSAEAQQLLAKEGLIPAR
ncbi:MAG: phosphate ABC transporter substrate-binding protein [Acidobacteria bacterium]|nr:phosphate ABC transporter substrate-binding protein [Acidobacteriota bacterium]